MQVSNEFLEPEIGQSMPKIRHYTKYQRKNRKDEVYKLHFEYGYSARQISNLMKINRNTINSDIQNHYKKLAKEFREMNYLGLFQNQLDRLNEQRSRLITTLDKTEDVNHKITVERMILDIDSKITHFVLKFIDNNDKNIESSVEFINNHYEDAGLEDRYISRKELIKIPVKTYQRFHKILKEERGY